MRESSPSTPLKVVDPSGAARRRLGLRNRLANGSAFRFPAPKSECDARPNLGAECPSLLGAGRLGGVWGCFAFPNDGSAAFPLAALVRASRFPNDCPWDSQPRSAPCGHFASLVRSTFGLRGYPQLRFGSPAELVVTHLPLIVLSVPLGGGGRSSRCVRLP